MAQKYKLVYCAKTDDDRHKGMLKVGDTEFTPTKQLSLYTPNDPVLQREAESRIRSWSGTAAAGAELVYCEALIRYNENTQNSETYRDSEVHAVLQQAGFPKVDFDSAIDPTAHGVPVLSANHHHLQPHQHHALAETPLLS